jgi:hypothetical protein
MNIILIPYRNREDHLDYFIKNTVPSLKKYLNPLKIIIIEQNNDRLFNRGKLLNTGFLEYFQEGKYFFTHDVDLNPYDKTIQEVYTKVPNQNEIIGIYTSGCDTLGGIVKFDKNTFQKINGFPDNFWGWGVEDKALQNRALSFDINISKYYKDNQKDKHDHFKLFEQHTEYPGRGGVNDPNTSKLLEKSMIEYEQFQHWSKNKKLERIFKNGLNTMKYLISKKLVKDEIIEHIYVDEVDDYF